MPAGLQRAGRSASARVQAGDGLLPRCGFPLPAPRRYRQRPAAAQPWGDASGHSRAPSGVCTPTRRRRPCGAAPTARPIRPCPGHRGASAPAPAARRGRSLEALRVTCPRPMSSTVGFQCSCRRLIHGTPWVPPAPGAPDRQGEIRPAGFCRKVDFGAKSKNRRVRFNGLQMPTLSKKQLATEPSTNHEICGYRAKSPPTRWGPRRRMAVSVSGNWRVTFRFRHRCGVR